MDNIKCTKRARTQEGIASEEPPVKKSKFNPPVDKPLNAGNLAQQGQEINYNQPGNLSFKGFPLSNRKVTPYDAPQLQYSANARLKKAIFDYLKAAQASHKEDIKQQIKNLIQKDFAAFVPYENISFKIVNPPLNQQLLNLLRQTYAEQKKNIDSRCTLSVKEGQFDEIKRLVNELNTGVFYQNCASADTVLHSLFRFFSFKSIIQHTTQLGQWIEGFQSLKQKALPVEALEELKGTFMRALQNDACVAILDAYLSNQSRVMRMPMDVQELNNQSQGNKIDYIKAVQEYLAKGFLEVYQKDTAKHSCASLIAKDLIKNLESSLPDDWSSINLSLTEKFSIIDQQESMDWESLRTGTGQKSIENLNNQVIASFVSSIESFYAKRVDGVRYLDQIIKLLEAQDNPYHTGIDGQLQAIEEVLEIVTTLSEKLSDQAEIFKIDLNATNGEGQTALDILALGLDSFIDKLSEPSSSTISTSIRAKIEGYFIHFVKLLNLLSNGSAVSENNEIVFSKEDRHAFLNLLRLVPDLQHYDGLLSFIYNHSFGGDTILNYDESDRYTTDIRYLEQETHTVNEWTADGSSRSPMGSEVYLCCELYAHLKNKDADAAQRLIHDKEIFLEHRQVVLEFLSGKDHIAQYDSLLSYIYFYIPFVKKDSMSENSDEETYL